MKYKKRFFALFLMINILASQFLSGAVFASATENTAKDWPAAPSVNAESAILMDLSSGAILYEKNAHQPQYPASITKIMTTLLAIEHCSMSEIVTFSHDAVFGIEMGSSHIGIDEGERLTVEQSLYAIMLASANEVSWGVGEHVAGTLSDFANMMNARAKELGCLNTHFVNANGLHHDDHYTTAYDMALISRAAMQYETFRKITSTKRYTIPPTNKHDVDNIFLNHHQMLMGNNYPQYKYEYCIGGKTGYTSKAGSTLVTFAKKGDMELVCVVMRANGAASPENQYTDTTGLFNWAFENFTQYNISAAASELEDSELPLFTKYQPLFDTKNTPLALNNSSVLLPNEIALEEATKNVTIYSDIKQTGSETVVGTITYTYNDRLVGNADIIFRTSDTNPLATTNPIKEVNADSIRSLERYNLKPYIIAGIFTVIIASVIAYFYFSRRNKRNNNYTLHF